MQDKIKQVIEAYRDELAIPKEADYATYKRQLMSSHFSWYVSNNLCEPYHMKDFTSIEALEKFLPGWVSHMYQTDTTAYALEYWTAAQVVAEEILKRLRRIGI